MDEIQQETQKKDEKGFPLAVVAVSLLVAVYFLFPAILIYPFYMAYGKSPPPGFSSALRKVFYPVIVISDRVPAYQYFIDSEFKWLGME